MLESGTFLLVPSACVTLIRAGLTRGFPVIETVCFAN